MSLQRIQNPASFHDMVITYLRWTPYDFMQSNDNFHQVERQQITENWLQNLVDEDDYRYIDETRHVIILAERLAWDSIFFGYPIVRLNAIIGDDEEQCAYVLAEWLEIAKSRGVAYVLSLVLPESLDQLRILGMSRFQLIETRLTYHQHIEAVLASERYPARMATADDLPILSRVASDNVNPFDRFHADPYIMPTDADRMMQTWVKASIETGFADFVIVPDLPEPKAFCTVKTHQSDWASWGINLAQSVVLGAVDPSLKGWYAKLISESNHHLKKLGATHVFWKTQATNRAAIRTAEKLGYRLGRAEHVYRIVL